MFRRVGVISFSLCLASCSFPRPLQDDVTSLPLAPLVRKIICEAKHELGDLLDERHLGGARSAYRRANKQLVELTARLSKPLDEERDYLQKRKAFLDNAKSANISEGQAVAAGLDVEIDEAKLRKLRKRGADALLDQARILDAIATYTHRLMVHNRRVQVVQKQLAQAGARTKKENEKLFVYYSQIMAFSFRFRIVETDIASISSSWKLPIFAPNLGGLSLGGSVVDSKERESDRNVKLEVALSDLHGLNCGDAPTHGTRLRAVYYPITGKIGLKEVMGQYFALMDRNQADRFSEFEAKTIFSKAEAYTDNILFTTTIAAVPTASIILNPTVVEQFNGGLTLSGTRKDYHSVLVSLYPGVATTDKEEKIQRMIIVQDDGIH